MSDSHAERIKQLLADAEVSVERVEQRSFPGERWLVVYVPTASMVHAQSLAGELESSLNAGLSGSEIPFSLVFRPDAGVATDEAKPIGKGRLSSPELNKLIQLVEARSRTSDALPSFQYVEDPRASLAAVAASRHQFIYGRRGVGKTALLLEAKRLAEREGDVTVWLNAHTFRGLDAKTAYLRVAHAVFTAILKHGGSSGAQVFAQVRQQAERCGEALATESLAVERATQMLPEQNVVLRNVLRKDLLRLNLYIDDFHYFPFADQPTLLDHAFGLMRECDGWLKIASIERLTRTFEPSTRVGLEIPHDASKIDLDRTLEDPGSAQEFLEHMLEYYNTEATGVGRPSAVAKRQALGRLVLASGGVPRDYLNLFGSAILQARKARANAQEVGGEDVVVAAGDAARLKKRDLEQDVASEMAGELMDALNKISSAVKGAGFSYFRVDLLEKSKKEYEYLAQLADLRFVHLIQAALSDQHKAGAKYEVYILDLSEYSDVRIKRGLHVLEFEAGRWYERLTGTVGTQKKLTGSQFRDALRHAPLVRLDGLLCAGEEAEN